ncbi:MAG: hypothetical protein QOJ89_3840 [bacterium]
MAREQREVQKDFGCRPPLGMAVMLWLNALMAAALGAGFAWAVVDAAAPAFDVGDLGLYFTCAAACCGFAGWLAWMAHRESRVRLIADRGGIALRTRGRERHAWAQIDRFEVGKLYTEGVVRMEAVDGHCGVMVLCGGRRIVLDALRTHAPFGGLDRDEIAARVRALNELHAAHDDPSGEPAVLESRARC